MPAHTVIIFFGEMGSGKSHCAARYARSHGFAFFEGDDVVTHDLLDRSGRFKPIPRGVIREFVRVLMHAVVDRASQCDSDILVVSQALYLDEDRCALADHLRSCGLAVRFWLVRTRWHRHVANLWSRPKGFRWVVYWLMNKPFFQRPRAHPFEVYRNVFFDTA